MKRSRSTAVAVLAALGATLVAPARPAGAESATVAVAVSREACRRLIAHVPAPDVDYRPGVDARGNAVAPADLAGSNAGSWLRPLVVPLTLDLGQIVDLPAAVEADIPLFDLTVDALGRVRVDGRPVGDETEAALAAACRERLE